MAVRVTREHGLSPEEADGKFEEAVNQVAAENGLSIVERAPRRLKVAGMGVTGEVVWDEQRVTVSASVPFAFGGMEAQIRSNLEQMLDRILSGGA